MYRCDVVNENEHHRIFILKAMCNRWEGGKGAWDGCTSWCIDKIAGKGLENNWYILVYDKMIKENLGRETTLIWSYAKWKEIFEKMKSNKVWSAKTTQL